MQRRKARVQKASATLQSADPLEGHALTARYLKEEKGCGARWRYTARERRNKSQMNISPWLPFQSAGGVIPLERYVWNARSRGFEWSCRKKGRRSCALPNACGPVTTLLQQLASPPPPQMSFRGNNTYAPRTTGMRTSAVQRPFGYRNSGPHRPNDDPGGTIRFGLFLPFFFLPPKACYRVGSFAGCFHGWPSCCSPVCVPPKNARVRLCVAPSYK